ncbi:two-component system sensor histidine kinase NtrB [Maridesulfovibrio bastinii]|uniref:two-component system sensor histidine kinase NtrB n=1 Tax=Maridesulfovibrio bastinii TaxID=47157 RepID=UPI000426F97E|nr:ATP-binding protein [Maridesulfovibrio bastinii]
MESLNNLVVDNIIESLPIGLIVISPIGEIIVLNEAVCQMLGLERKKHLGCGWAELFITGENENLEFNQVIIDTISNHHTMKRTEVVYTDHNGRKKLFNMTSSFLKEEGNVAGLVLLMQDVTEDHRRTEREKKILSRYADLQKDRMEGLNSLARAVAHQLRNPAMAISGLSKIVHRKTEDPAIREYVEAIEEEAGRLENLVRGVNDYASVKNLSIRREKTIDLLENSLSTANSLLKCIDESIEMKLECLVENLNVDPALFVSVLRELFMNASNFTPQKHTVVKVKVFAKNKKIYLAVKDKGMGIDPRQLPFVFDPFYTTKPKGVGMGLPRVKRIIFEHGGKIILKSKGKDTGTTALIELPETKPDYDHPAEESSPAAE